MQKYGGDIVSVRKNAIYIIGASALLVALGLIIMEVLL